MPPASYRANMGLRRKSVFAETYEPDEDDAAVQKVSAHNGRRPSTENVIEDFVLKNF